MIIASKRVGFMLLSCFLMYSCEGLNSFLTGEDSDKETTVNNDTVSITGNFIFNVPIVSDTVYIDKQYNTDIRIEIEGYSIDTIKLIKSNYSIILPDSSLFSSSYLNSDIDIDIDRLTFVINAVKTDNNDTVVFKSDPILVKSDYDLSNHYVFPTVEEGKLKLVWNEFDSENRQKYIVERWIMNDYLSERYAPKRCHQQFEVETNEFIDNYYVGEKAEYKISMINKDGSKQECWYYKKPKEQVRIGLLQNATRGYKLFFNKCKYYSNFGQYYVEDRDEFNPKSFNQSHINDTTLVFEDALFGKEARFLVITMPKNLPDGYTVEDKKIYGSNMNTRYGLSSMPFVTMTPLDNKTLAYTYEGIIYKYDTESGEILGTISNPDAEYSYLQTTPDGKYLFSRNSGGLTNYDMYYWSADFSQSAMKSFQYTTRMPPVSNNLRTIMSVPSSSSSSCKLAIYNVTDGTNIHTTDYIETSSFPTISPNGDYFFIYGDSKLKLCNYDNGVFNVIWSETNSLKYYRYYCFNRLNNSICYVWDDNKVFSIRNTSDFSLVKSFSINVEEIVDIDYYSNMIMGYDDKIIRIYNLNTGSLIKEIPSYLLNLFLYDYKTILFNNTIYNCHGMKYVLE